jgi:hypothetical protein
VWDVVTIFWSSSKDAWHPGPALERVKGHEDVFNSLCSLWVTARLGTVASHGVPEASADSGSGWTQMDMGMASKAQLKKESFMFSQPTSKSSFCH